jgi:hypothetical protein
VANGAPSKRHGWIATVVAVVGLLVALAGVVMGAIGLYFRVRAPQAGKPSAGLTAEVSNERRD